MAMVMSLLSMDIPSTLSASLPLNVTRFPQRGELKAATPIWATIRLPAQSHPARFSHGQASSFSRIEKKCIPPEGNWLRARG